MGKPGERRISVVVVSRVELRVGRGRQRSSERYIFLKNSGSEIERKGLPYCVMRAGKRMAVPGSTTNRCKVARHARCAIICRNAIFSWDHRKSKSIQMYMP